MIIAIDGTAGSGKSTTAKKLAEKLNFVHIDSGSLYRVATYFCIMNNIDFDDSQLEIMLDDMEISFNGKKILLNGRNVTSDIREHYISDKVSDYSSNIIIRNKLSNLQRKLAEDKNVVVEGRDIATKVFPSADYKFYLSADIEVRADRRYNQMVGDSKVDIRKEDVLNNLIKRDELDISRKHSPLLKDDEAIEIDTTNLSIDEQVNLIIKTINKE